MRTNAASVRPIDAQAAKALPRMRFTRFTASLARSQMSSRSRLAVFAASHRPPSGPSKWSGIMPMFRTAELALCSTSPGVVGITMRSAY